MTEQDHEFLFLLFARIYEYFGVLTETLKSRGLWTEDDERAFANLVHFDNAKFAHHIAHAYLDYAKLAKQTGVVTGLTEPPPASGIPPR